MLDEVFLGILCCPVCRETLIDGPESLTCNGCGTKYAIKAGIPILRTHEFEREDIWINQTKWSQHWKAWNWDTEHESYRRANLPFIFNHLLPVESGQWFLEVGGGPSYLCYEVSGLGLNVVSVDLDLNILLKAKASFERNGRNGYFVCGCMNQLPFRPGIFDVSAGIGVLEHSSRIDESVKELARILKPGGRTFQTVPHFSLLTLVNNSLRMGTVPRVSVLHSLTKLLHVRLLRGKLMRYGYEESYTHGFLRRIFKRAGFRMVDVGFYDYDQTILKRHKVLGKACHKLIRIKVFGRAPFSDIAFVVAFR